MKKRKRNRRTPPNMKKRKRKAGRPPKIKPMDQAELVHRLLPPFDPGEFKRVFALAMKAAAKERPPTNPELPRVKIVEEDGSVSEYQVSETLSERGMVSVMEHYKDDFTKAFSAMVRVNEVTIMARSEDLAPWVRSSPDRPASQLHPAVIEAAATTRLMKAGGFPLPEFLREVQRIAREKYPEEDAW